jgi:protein-tyrosine phosphatase
MGTVHGVYLKYVGLSALSLYGYSYFMRHEDGGKLTMSQLLGHSSLRILSTSSSSMTAAAAAAAVHNDVSCWRLFPALVLGYSAVVNGVIAVLFKMEVGMHILGKNPKTGQIPQWSYIVFFPFHIPTLLYTHIHTRYGTHKTTATTTTEKKKDNDTTDDGRKEVAVVVYEKVPVATEVQPGWWVGGWYAHELDKDWAAIIDLTVEFPETCIDRTRAYLSLPTWDGVPATPEQLEEAASFAVLAMASSSNGNGQGCDILVHCAHGRGRSTTVMCACLVKAGLFRTWQEAFEQGIQPKRPVCKLNRRMRQNLTKWQEAYVNPRDKKGQ